MANALDNSVELPPVAMQLSGLSFGYRSSVPVVREVGASLAAGRVTVLVGPNASGKSTLLRLMLGVISPWEGRVEVGGLPLAKMTPADRAQWISYVPQRPASQFAFTVRQIVAMGRFGQDAIMAGPAIDEVLLQAGLLDLQHRVFAQLSGGQQQRVILARAELQAGRGGRVMLLDEPGSHLDLANAHATMQRLRQLAAGGLAVLVVVHDLNLAAAYADDAWLMHEGALLAAGRWDEVLQPQRLSEVYGVALQESHPDGQARPVFTVPLELQ
ncbi:MAG: ABC transporter ATP-binding protein [Planctomycetota bacterium]